MGKSDKDSKLMNGKSDKSCNVDENGSIDSENQGLKSNMGLFDAVMLGVGCIIGSGIFVSTKGVHENAGSVGLSLIIWILSGVFSAFGAYSYAELGTFIKRGGGDYAYVLVAFGKFMAFLRLWTECMIIRPCTLATVSIIFATYVLQPLFSCGSPPFTLQFLAAGCLILLALVNALSTRITNMVQRVFTLAKLFALALIILTGFYLLCVRSSDELEAFNNMFDGSKYDVQKLSIALYSGLWSFNGWNYITIMTDELKNPQRNLPIAIGLSCFICTIVYVMANVAFYAGVSLDEIVDSNAVAVTFAEHYYGPLAFMMPIFVAMSCFGTVNGVLMTSSRLFYYGARENQMPNALSMLNPYVKTPMPSVFFTLFLSLGYLMLSNNIYSLINSIQIVNWIAIAMAAAGLLYMRKTLPVDRHPRPVKVNLIFPIVFLIGCIYLIIVPIFAAPVDSLTGIALFFTSVPVYFIFIAWESKPAFINKAADSITMFCQKLMLVASDKKGN